MAGFVHEGKVQADMGGADTVISTGFPIKQSLPLSPALYTQSFFIIVGFLFLQQSGIITEGIIHFLSFTPLFSGWYSVPIVWFFSSFFRLALFFPFFYLQHYYHLLPILLTQPLPLSAIKCTVLYWGFASIKIFCSFPAISSVTCCIFPQSNDFTNILAESSFDIYLTDNTS